MATDSIQCPVCGEELSAYTNFCPSCSFEIHILPNDIPNALREMEEQRVRYAKNTYLGMKSEITRLQAEIEQKSTEILNTKASYEERIVALEDHCRNADEQLNRKQEEIINLGQQNKKLQDNFAVLNQQNKKLQEEVTTAQAAAKASVTNQPLAYLVMTQNDNVSAIYIIQEGENTFGYAASHDMHHQIICNAQVADIHFAIRATSTTDPKGRKRSSFTVSSAGGNIYGATNEANLISGEIPFEKNGSIYIEDVRFTLVANKK